jgi:hypothetical protein
MRCAVPNRPGRPPQATKVAFNQRHPDGIAAVMREAQRCYKQELGKTCTLNATVGAMNRWYGGMVHDLGHAFGLPDATSADGTPMSASFYNCPNTHFSRARRIRS